jgi:ATP phosphoribosyltransferase regulatory subunit
MSAWVLPDHIADVLPSEARQIEDIRRKLLDMARCYGYELVMPPLMEHLESLLCSSDQGLDLQTFKLVDQLSGRMLGVRADSTPQVARIDAHLLNRRGVARLCYCGPVLHTLPASPQSSREPLQFGAEIFGHAGLEADLEILTLALDTLSSADVVGSTVDFADARIVHALLAQSGLSADQTAAVYQALAAKDTQALTSASAAAPPAIAAGLAALMQLYGDISILVDARARLPAIPLIAQALDDLAWLAGHVQSHAPGVQVSFDLSDLRGYSYYSGIRFSIFAAKAPDALVRGGRYNAVGAAFGRDRPAVGFSLDVKALVRAVAPPPLHAAVRAPWGEDPALRAAIARLRAEGHTVVCVLPGHESEVEEFHCDRALVLQSGGWTLTTL